MASNSRDYEFLSDSIMSTLSARGTGC